MAIHSERLPDVFKALGDPTRLAVVERLASGPATVSDLSAPFRMAGPSFLKHLGVLESAGVVRSNKTGRVRTVSLAPETLVWVDDWVARRRGQWEARLDRLGEILKQGDN